jgi:predicted Zn-dependent protease
MRRSILPALFTLSIIFVSALIVSCVTTGPGGQKSFILVSSEQEVSVGAAMDVKLRETEKLLPDSLWQMYLAGIGQKIVGVCDRKDITFHFAVIESDQVNAFAAPGGFVYFYTGLLREMDKESEIAAVMAHEISHVVARHGVKRLQSVMGASIVMDLALGGKSENTKALAGAALGVIFAGYSRSQESEADNFGITYMARAGWDPNGAIAMFQKLSELTGNRSEDFFEKLSSDHPDTQSRIAAARQQVAGMNLSANLTLNTPKFIEMKKRLPAKQASLKR